MNRIFTIFFSFFCYSSFATHHRGGDITYKHLSGYTYEITVTIYTRPESNMADRCVITIHFGDGDSAVVCRSNYESGDPSADVWGATCSNIPECSTHHMGEWTGIPSVFDSKKNIYTTTHTFPGAWTFIISCTDPNRVSHIINIPSDLTPISLSDTLIINPFIAGNSSPVFSNFPLDTAFEGVCNNYNPEAIDPDGDSLSYELIPCEESPGQTVAGYFLPAGISLNAVTGDLTWCYPTNLNSFPEPDKYNFSIRIKEWRKIGNNYVRIGTVARDVQIFVYENSSMQVNTIDKISISIAVYPNPASDFIHLQTINMNNNSYDIALYDFTGKIMFKQLNIKEKNHTFSSSEFKNGIYLLRVNSNNKDIFAGKIIIQH